VVFIKHSRPDRDEHVVSSDYPEFVTPYRSEPSLSERHRGYLIWNLLNREVWFETFIDGGGKTLAVERSAMANA
jgi:hypothetical protein